MKKSKVADTISLSVFEGHSTNISQAMLHLNVLLKFLTTSPALPEAFGVQTPPSMEDVRFSVFV